MAEQKKVKPKVRLVGEDGNICNLIGICQRALRNAGQTKEAQELWNRINTEAKSYGQALRIIYEYVEEA